MKRKSNKLHKTIIFKGAAGSLPIPNRVVKPAQMVLWVVCRLSLENPDSSNQGFLNTTVMWSQWLSEVVDFTSTVRLKPRDSLEVPFEN
jgi:hypothetical protein